MTDVEKRRKFIINTAYFVLLGVIAYLVYTYAFGVCFPLVSAFVIAAMLQRPRNFLIRKTFLKKGLASGICVFTFYMLFLAVFVLIGVKVFDEIRDFVNYIILQFQDLDKLVNNIEDFVLSFIARLPEFISKNVTDTVVGFFVNVREFLAGTSSELPDQLATSLGDSFSVSWITAPLSGVISTVSQIPSFIISFIISIVATCFMTAEYDYVKNFIKIQFPEEKRKDLSRAKALLSRSLGKMARAYALILFITFIELFAGFSILSLTGIFTSSYIPVLAVIIAVVDIVPMLGTGTVLLPWTVYSFVVGDYAMAIGVFIMYAVITVIRQIIEPKLVAGQLGLSPVITISAMFLGLKFLGFLGMFAAPLAIIMLKLLTDEGIIHLWKSPVIAAREEAAKKEAAEKEKAEKEAAAEKDASAQKASSESKE